MSRRRNLVVGWVLDVPSQLQINLFTEQMLAAVLGLSLALTFLTFPLSMKTSGEEAIALKALTGEQSVAGPIDLILAALSLVAQWWQARRHVAAWWLWIFVDVIYIGVYLFKSLHVTAALYVVFIGLALLGVR